MRSNILKYSAHPFGIILKKVTWNIVTETSAKVSPFNALIVLEIKNDHDVASYITVNLFYLIRYKQINLIETSVFLYYAATGHYQMYKAKYDSYFTMSPFSAYN